MVERWVVATPLSGAEWVDWMTGLDELSTAERHQKQFNMAPSHGGFYTSTSNDVPNMITGILKKVRKILDSYFTRVSQRILLPLQKRIIV